MRQGLSVAILVLEAGNQKTRMVTGAGFDAVFGLDRYPRALRGDRRPGEVRIVDW